MDYESPRLVSPTCNWDFCARKLVFYEFLDGENLACLHLLFGLFTLACFLLFEESSRKSARVSVICLMRVAMEKRFARK